MRDHLNLLCDGEQGAFESAFKELEEAVEKKSASYIVGKIYKRCVELYVATADWAKNYIFRPLERLIKNRLQRNTRQNRAEANKRDAACPTYKNALDRIIYTDDTVRQSAGVNQFYICRMIKDNGKVVYQKFGTTHRDTSVRMYEHLRDHWDKGVRKIIVDRVYDVKDMPDVTVESFFRAKYGRKYKEQYIKLDRFGDAVIDLDEADRDFINFMMGN
jgi:hypothetical protein